VKVQQPNLPQTSRFQSYMHTLREAFSTAKNAISARVNALKEKLPAYQETANKFSSQKYVQLVWKRDAGEVVGLSYEKNLLEEIGDWMLFPMVDLPYKLSSVQYSPIAVGTAATAGALFSLKFLFHPIKTAAMVGRKLALLPSHAYFFAQFSVIGLACRSIGRMTNASLTTRTN